MKLFFSYILMICLVLITNTTYSQCNKCDSLFNQIKDDKLFTSSIAISESIINIYKENAIRAPRSENMREQDSIYMRDSTISIEEKYATMNYKGLKVIRELNQQAMEIEAKLEELYPLSKELTDSEYQIFTKMATEYYMASKKQ
jgi:hypothetical protein